MGAEVHMCAQRFDDEDGFPSQEPDPSAARGAHPFRVLGLVLLLSAPFVMVGGIIALWPGDATDEIADAGAPPEEAVTMPADTPVDPVLALAASQERVHDLEVEIDARKAELDLLRIDQDDEREVTRRRHTELETDMVRLKRSLAKAKGERDDLRGRLTTALAELDLEIEAHAGTRQKATVLAAANTENVWVAFTQRTKIDVCDQMTRKGREKCREKVDGWLDDARHDRFASCVDNHKTVPSVWTRERNADIPSNAEAVGIDTPGARDDYYVLFCDPTLPEAQVADAGLASPVVFVATAP